MRELPHWYTSKQPERPLWQELALMAFAPWVEQRWFSLGERIFIGLLVWTIVIFQMVLPIIFLT